MKHIKFHCSTLLNYGCVPLLLVSIGFTRTFSTGATDARYTIPESTFRDLRLGQRKSFVVYDPTWGSKGQSRLLD